MLNIIDQFLKFWGMWLAGVLPGPVRPPVPLPPPVQQTVIYPQVWDGTTDNSVALPDTPDGLVLSASGIYDPRLNAIGRFMGATNCSGFYAQTSTLPDAPVYFLTNAHCTLPLQRLNSEVVADSAMRVRDYTVEFKYMFDDFSHTVKVNAKKLAYLTDKTVDLAIVELDTTPAQLKAAGITPLPVASPPEAGIAMRIYGFPGGVPLSQSSCKNEAPRDIIEDQWLWYAMNGNNCAGIIGGSSGSVLISNINRGVWGLLNTTTRTMGGYPNYQPQCTLNNPCEWNQTTGAFSKENTNYGFNLTIVKKCFDGNGVFDVNQTGCQLEKTRTFDYFVYNAKRSFTRAEAATQKLKFEVSDSKNTFYRVTSVKQFNRNANDGFTKITAKVTELTLPLETGEYILTVKQGNDLARAKRYPFTIADNTESSVTN